MIGPMMAGFYVKYTNIRNLWVLVAALALIGSLMMYKLYNVDKVKGKVIQTELYN